MFFAAMHPDWQDLLPQWRERLDNLAAELPADILPLPALVMRAFAASPNNIKAVIIGQDPYPTPGHACGLAFAVQPPSGLPRSLQNIMRELHTDASLQPPISSAAGDLQRWVEQGVMLLNRQLTLPTHPAWAEFTEDALRALVRLHAGKLVVILWGAQAAKSISAVGSAPVIASAHPSPLSARRGFFGSRPFSRTNRLLQEMGRRPIDWSC